MNKKNILHVALLACSYSSLIGSFWFSGDLDAPGNGNDGFSFNLLPKLGKNRTQETIYLASATDLGAAADDVKKYALSAASSSGTGCIGIANEKATINGVTDQLNPLYGAQLSTLNMAASCPVVMKNGDTTKLYVVTSSPLSPITNILTNNGVNDTNQAAGSFITTAESDNQNSIQGVDPLIIAAVKPAAGDFGQNGGGIALLRKTNTGLVQQKAVVLNDTVIPVSIDNNTNALFINSPLAALEANKVNLYWSEKLFRLFVGVQATNGGLATDGSKSICVGYIKDNGENATLSLYSITPDNTITNETKIVGTVGANLRAYTYKQTVMFTSTGLTYLIMVGESEDPQNNNNMQQACYALPLVDESADPAKASTWQTSATHATLAKKGSLPTTFYRYNQNNVSVATTRGFQAFAAAPAELYDKTDAEVIVGGTNVTIPNLTTGVIVDLEVYNDTVFVLLSGSMADNQPAGVFYSQAIFDENGVIKNWTTWQRFTCSKNIGINTPIKDFAYMPSQDSTFQLQAAVNNTRSVTLNKWSTGSKDGLLGGSFTDDTIGLASLLTREFPQEEGGVLGLFDFPATFGNIFFDADTAMMIATGYKKIGLILTKVNTAPVTEDFRNRTLLFTNGTIDPEIIAPFANVTTFVSGGVLDDLGAITAATLITNIPGNDLRYIIVGGTSGAAILRRTDNNQGFDAQLDNGFSGLGPNLAFEILGDFDNVKKLWTAAIGNDQYLFILTLDGLHRIAVNELSQPIPTVVTLATVDTITTLPLASHDFFTDVIISDKLCLLGTNKGLLRNGNGTNICTAADSIACDWTSLNIPAPYQHIVQLVPLLSSPLSYEFATQDNGQVYALAHSNTLTTSALHSFSIKDISGIAIDDTTCNPVYKETVNGIYAPFMSFGSLRNSLATNGAMTVTTSLTEPHKNAQVFSMPINNFGIIKIIENYPFTEIKLSLPNNAAIIRGVVYNTALGSWIAYGDFGIRVCE